jgi:hypothetical protein
MAAIAAENSAAGRRIVTVRINHPPDVCLSTIDHVSCPGEEGFRPNDALFCEALALQNPLSQPCKERSKVMGSKGEDHSLGLTDRADRAALRRQLTVGFDLTLSLG